MRKATALYRRSVVLVVTVASFFCFSSPNLAQPVLPAVFASAPKPVPTVGPHWKDLSTDQQAILKPLAPTWDSLDSARKRKWLSLAQSYPRLGLPEQEKMQSRMSEWAALTPREREMARLNFAETKKVPPSDRTANWDAYQALPVEDRQKLAAKATPAPAGAAIAPKHATGDKVTPVPVTRHTAAANTPAGEPAAPGINRKTLLPQPTKPVPAASAPTN
jgi:hypothetical protein